VAWSWSWVRCWSARVWLRSVCWLCMGSRSLGVGPGRSATQPPNWWALLGHGVATPTPASTRRAALDGWGWGRGRLRAELEGQGGDDDGQGDGHRGQQGQAAPDQQPMQPRTRRSVLGGWIELHGDLLSLGACCALAAVLVGGSVGRAGGGVVVGGHRLLPAALTLRDWRSRAPTNLPNRRGQSGDRLALSGLPRSADSVHLAGQLSVGFGRLLAVGGVADGGEHVSATSKSHPRGRLPARE
jgi:hypothetical protein